MNAKAATMKEAGDIPVDVKAYLVLAAQQLMTEQGFQATSQDDVEKWLAENAVATGERAMKLQIEMFEKFTRQQEKVTSILCADVYRKIKTRELNRNFNRTVAEILE